MDIQEKLQSVPGWEHIDNTIQKTFTTDDFASALLLANKIGELAEDADHHPDLLVSWGKVQVTLTTHSEGGLTEKDFALAKEIEKVA